jgi:ammonium transporter, Amt family
MLIKVFILLCLMSLSLIGHTQPTTPPSTTNSAVPIITSATTPTITTPSTPTNIKPITPDKADMAWLLLATLLVVMMAVPGLGLFYGGIVRAKNMLSVLMQVSVCFCLIVVLWALYGYSLAFTEGNAFIGGTNALFLNGLFDASKQVFSNTGTFSKGIVIPELLFAMFQASFAGITCTLIVGAFAERAKFSGVLLFTIIWFTFSYLPIAHMVWFWMGPDAYTNATTTLQNNQKAGLIWQWGALDFAGGTVVHINAAVAGLIGAYFIGKRQGLGKEAMAPHNLPLTMTGAGLLWVGWFGFNAGSALEANTSAVLAFANTLLAGASAMVTWVMAEWAFKKHPSMLGAASGVVAGLVAITPAAGNVGPIGALLIGAISGVVCLWGVTQLKRWLKADDALDVFGVHGVGGILGALLTGIFTSPNLGGVGIITDWATMATGFDSIANQLWIQCKAVGLTIAWSSIVSIIAYFIVQKTVGLRVSIEEEREGLDINTHGESAYRLK